MAITTDDFNKIWASASPLTPYSFSASQYKEGWNFIGGTPPSRQMWDFLQKNNDEKMQYLLNHFDNYLPLTGGTMSGTIKWSGTDYNVIKRDSGNNGVCIIGGDADNFSGASLQLFGQTHGSYAGRFYLRASTRSDGNDTSHPSVELAGKPNGSLTWDSKEVERVNASGSNYIRYESGIQICWGSSADFNATGEKTVTFPAAFTGISYRLAVGRDWVMNWNENYYVKEKTNTSFTIVVTGTASTNNHFYSYVAVGYWK